jgi:hypothetical protein
MFFLTESHDARDSRDMICTISSDVLAYVATFLLSDNNIIRLFICCKKLKNSQFLAKVDFKGTYRQKNCVKHKTLFELRKRIRIWSASKPLEDLPPYLYKLRFDHKFNKQIDKVRLPLCLKQLTFGHAFNQNIDNVQFPSSLHTLIFGWYFNQPIEHVNFPSSLRELIFGYWFDQNIDNVTFPSSLQQLIFGQEFDRNIENVKFPSNLQELSFFAYALPRNIDKVKFPLSLRKLRTGWMQYVRISNDSLGLLHITFAHFVKL